MLSAYNAFANTAPYSTMPFSIKSTSTSQIAGEIFVPEGKGPFPAVVIVPGSAGSQPVTRDGQFGLYRANADLFARRGIVAALYDKRGCGNSTGNRHGALLEDHAEDASSIADWLANQANVDPSRIGFWGISNGGWVAPLAARHKPDAAFLILVSAPASCEGRQRQYEWRKDLESQCVNPATIDQLLATRWSIWNYLATNQGFERAFDAYDAAKSQPWWKYLDRVIYPRWLNEQYVNDPSHSDEFAWFRGDMLRDPLDVLAESTSPVLAIYGDQDNVIPIADTVSRMQTFAALSDRTVRVVRFPACGHPLIRMGLPPHFAEGYAERIASWVLSQPD